jgi:hypothetical protein
MRTWAPVRSGDVCVQVASAWVRFEAPENLRLANFARRRIDDADPLVRIVHERLFPGDMVLAHRRNQAALEAAQQVAEAAIAAIFSTGPRYSSQWIVIVTPGRFSSRASPPNSARPAAAHFRLS